MTPIPRILLLEDNPRDAELFRARLEADGFACDLHVARRKDEFEQMLHGPGRWDLVVSDFSLPNYNGLAALELKKRLQPEAPFVFFSGTLGEQLAVESLQRGATDYVLKRDAARLVAALRRALDDARERTRRHEAERRIREQADIIDRAAEAIVVTDLENRVTYWNRGAEQLYGLPSAEAVGRGVADIFPPILAEQLARAHRTAEQAGDWHGEITGENRASRMVVADLRLTLICDDLGRPRARLAIATDITERKAVQEQMLRIQRLENIGLLAAGIAHDLNNVLAPIMMAGPLLRMRATATADLSIIDNLEKSAERGAALVRQILGFAHGVGGGEKQLVQLRHVLRDLVAMMVETFPKSIRLVTEIAGDLWTVKANPTQFHQVALNLCVNARDAMPEGGELRLSATNRRLTEAEARLHPGARAGAHVVLEVSDTGTGIPPAVLAKMWEPFFTTKAEGKGTGLGLSTVRTIVTDHYGFVAVETAPDRGTVFRVFLPAAEAGAAHETAAAPHGVPRAHGESILLVDDEETIRETASAIFTRHGYHVLTARDGFEALTLFSQHPLDIELVVCDFNMPGLSGDVLSRVLRALRPDVKILVCSGQPNPQLVADKLADGFLQKPFTGGTLLAAAHALTHGAAPLRPAPNCDVAA